MQTDWLNDLKSVDSCSGLMPTPVSCTREHNEQVDGHGQNEFDQSQRLTKTPRPRALRTRADTGGSSAADVWRQQSERTHRHFAGQLDARLIVRIGAALGQSAAAQFDVDAANFGELS